MYSCISITNVKINVSKGLFYLVKKHSDDILYQGNKNRSEKKSKDTFNETTVINRQKRMDGSMGLYCLCKQNKQYDEVCNPNMVFTIKQKCRTILLITCQ